jgi:hypothetical protein
VEKVEKRERPVLSQPPVTQRPHERENLDREVVQRQSTAELASMAVTLGPRRRPLHPRRTERGSGNVTRLNPCAEAAEGITVLSALSVARRSTGKSRLKLQTEL